MKKKRIVSGEYNQYGYTVWLNNEIIYASGNHTQDSQQSATNEQDCLTLRQVRSLCIKTVKDIARENKAVYGGVERLFEN
jgi:hypothetical protein